MAKRKPASKSKKAATKRSGAWPEAFLRNIWPQERDWFARPDRLKYVRKMVKTDGCVFCQARDQGVGPQSLCLYRNDWAMVCLNKYPYNSGHLMVLPTRHCGDLSELNESEYLELQRLLKKMVEVVKVEYKVSGLNIGLNMGAVAGAGMPDHLHWHVIPRWAGDTNFFPLIAETKVVPETLEQTFDRYSRHLKDMPK